MRSSDLFYGLLAAVAAFGAVVTLAADVDPSVAIVFLAFAAVAAAMMLWGAHSAPQVLLVGRRDGRRNLLESELDTAGFVVASCEGPATRPCPVLNGQSCPVPARPWATVAYLDDASHHVPPCDRHFRVPTIAVHAERGSVPGSARRHVRWSDGTRSALDALHESLRS